MNNKGFTLVEMLAVVVILSLIMGIATVSVLGTIKNSKKNSEKVFVDKVSNLVESYISLEGSKLKVIDEVGVQFKKCKEVEVDGYCSESIDSSVYELDSFDLSNITAWDVNLIDKDKMINPKNKRQCLSDDGDATVRVFKDSQKVYYYYADLSSLSCEISSDRTIITNIPENLCVSLELSCDNVEE